MLKNITIAFLLFFVINLLAQQIDNKPVQNDYNINFNAYSLNSGIYFYTIQANSTDGMHSFTATKKMILMR
jgi:hypothetical protein